VTTLNQDYPLPIHSPAATVFHSGITGRDSSSFMVPSQNIMPGISLFSLYFICAALGKVPLHNLQKSDTVKIRGNEMAAKVKPV
jgi:hypothetical protein